MKSKKRLCLALPYFLCLACSGTYADESSDNTLNDAFSGNSLLVVNRFGPAFFRYSADGSFEGYNPEGVLSSLGEWRAKEGNLCMTVTSQLQKQNPVVQEPTEFCMGMNGLAVGSKITKADVRRGEIDYHLVLGHPRIDEALRAIE